MKADPVISSPDEHNNCTIPLLQEIEFEMVTEGLLHIRRSRKLAIDGYYGMQV
jgi:hypothetical protein